MIINIFLSIFSISNISNDKKENYMTCTSSVDCREMGGCTTEKECASQAQSYCDFNQAYGGAGVCVFP